MKRAFFGLVCFWLLSGSVSAQRYFPDHAFSTDDSANQFKIDWYSKNLKALEEPSLWELSQESKQQVYRFLWLRTFHHPVAVRIEFQSDGSASVTVKVTDGAGGYAPGNLVENRANQFSRIRVKWFLDRVDELKYWNLPTEEAKNGVIDLDGAQWILEATRNGHYKIVDRWSPKDGPIRELGLDLMINLADLPLLYKEVY
jgi:hypothetical protein